MKIINLKVEHKDHDICILNGKKATFTFNPNTHNGEELGDFISQCDDTDWQSVAEKLAEALQDWKDVWDRWEELGVAATPEGSKRIYEKAHLALNEYQKLKDEIRH